MQELIEMLNKDVEMCEKSFERALSAYQSRKALRKNFPNVIRNLKNGIKSLNRSGISCKPLQAELKLIKEDLRTNEEIMEFLSKDLQPCWELLQKRKEVLVIVEKLEKGE